MNDYTRVNELQDKILQAIDIVNSKALSSLNYDKTILCTIVDHSKCKEGQYQVTDGIITFAAYSNETNLRENNQVYVTIPNGDYENQKIIVGKKTQNENRPYVFITPFDSYFEMTDNLVQGQNGIVSILANGKEDNKIICETIKPEGADWGSGFTRLGLKFSIRTLLPQKTLVGNYGVALEIKCANVEEIVPLTFDSSEMYGNPYRFESYYQQEAVFDISFIENIESITPHLYQLKNFQDNTGKLINEVPEDEEGLMFDDILIKDFHISLGYAAEGIENDIIEIYTSNGIVYNNSENDANTPKTLNLRWMHIGSDDSYYNMKELAAAPFDYTVSWYQYRVGTEAADIYCGPFWEKVKSIEYNAENKQFNDITIKTEKTGEEIKPFEYTFIPQANQQQEKVKAIAIVNNIPYYSNTIVLENNKEVPSQATLDYLEALEIRAADETNGNYYLYGQNFSIKDSNQSHEIRTLELYFDADGNGVRETKISQDQKDNVTWWVPVKKTMLNFTGVAENTNAEFVEITGNELTYTIDKDFDYSKNTNNTVVCEYQFNGNTYRAQKTFSFGLSGTMGTQQTLVIDFADANKNYFIPPKNDDNTINDRQGFNLKVQLYDEFYKPVNMEGIGVKWAWYVYYGQEAPPDLDGVHSPEIKINGFSSYAIAIISATVGDLTTYFPIPTGNNSVLRPSDNLSGLQGATEVIYQPDGLINYKNIPYGLILGDGTVYTETIPVNYKGKEQNVKIQWGLNFDYTDIDQNGLESWYNPVIENNKLKPLGIYVEKAPAYAVEAWVEFDEQRHILWTQPILVMQNRWGSTTINNWDGQSLQIDKKNSTIMARGLAAGKKEDDNTFTGVVLGDWSHTNASSSLTTNTGIYGFSKGAMSYAFKDDGTAFIGQDGGGRIEINGNDATISSGIYKDRKVGMEIGLGNTKDSSPYLTMSKENVTLDPVEEYPLQVGQNFKVDWDGDIEAKGTIYAEKGSIGNWTIEGGNIIGKPIKDAEGKIHNPMISLGEANQPTSIKLFSKIKYSYPANIFESWHDDFVRIKVYQQEDKIKQNFIYSFSVVQNNIDFKDNILYLRLDTEYSQIDREKYKAYHNYFFGGEKEIESRNILFMDSLTKSSIYIKLYKDGPFAIEKNGEYTIVEFDPKEHYNKKNNGDYFTRSETPDMYPYYTTTENGIEYGCIYLNENDAIHEKNPHILYSYNTTNYGNYGYNKVDGDSGRPQWNDWEFYYIKKTDEEKETAQIFLGKEGILTGRHIMMDGRILFYDQQLTEETSGGGLYYNNLLGAIGYVTSNDGGNVTNAANGIGMQRRVDYDLLYDGYRYPLGGLFSVKVTSEHIGLAFKADEKFSIKVPFEDRQEMYCGNAYITITKTGRISIYAEDGVFINNKRVEGT